MYLRDVRLSDCLYGPSFIWVSDLRPIEFRVSRPFNLLISISIQRVTIRLQVSLIFHSSIFQRFIPHFWSIFTSSTAAAFGCGWQDIGHPPATGLVPPWLPQGELSTQILHKHQHRCSCHQWQHFILTNFHAAVAFKEFFGACKSPLAEVITQIDFPLHSWAFDTGSNPRCGCNCHGNMPLPNGNFPTSREFFSQPIYGLRWSPLAPCSPLVGPSIPSLTTISIFQHRVCHRPCQVHLQVSTSSSICVRLFVHACVCAHDPA